MRQLTAEQRIELVHVSLMRSPPFAIYSGLFMVGKTSISDTVLTACTDGRNTTYGRKFVGELTDKELAFLVLHENLHKCYRHLTIWQHLYKEDARLANNACDYVINLQLVDMDSDEKYISFPRDKTTRKLMGLLDERFRGMDSKQVFDILKREQEECDDEDGSDDDDDDGGDGDAANEGAGEARKNPSTKGNSQPTSFDEHDWENAQLTDKEATELSRDIEQALRQGSVYAGKVGANIPRQVGELLKPKVDWREVLRRFIRVSLRDRDSASWRKAHKNYLWQDVILPSILGKRVKHLVVAVDTSGSIVGPLLTAFLSEMNKIVKDVVPDRIDVLYWDTSVNGHECYKGVKDILHRTNPRGGGGTTPDCLVPYIEDHKINKPDALVVLTDGYMSASPATWASLKCPVLWCVMGNSDVDIPCGKKLIIEE